MRKDAKIALCVILALMVLVVIIWGRSPKPEDEVALGTPPAPESGAAKVVATPAGRQTPPAPAPAPLPSAVEAARHEAPAAPPVEHSSLYPPETAMINHLQPTDRAVVRHEPPPAEDSRLALAQEAPKPAAAGQQTPPAPAPPKAEPKPKPAVVHVVAKGDTYIGLAEKYYQDGSKWHLIQDANKAEATSLRIGQKITIPPLPAPAAKAEKPAPAPPAKDSAPKPPAPAVAAPPPAAPANTYTVKKGESFYSIARNVYRDPAKWQKIYERNRAKLPDPSKPGSLQAGTILELPALASSR